MLTVAKASMSLERETLEQIVDSDMPLQVIRNLYPNHETFVVAIHGLLRNGDVRLLSGGREVPRWRWRGLFETGGVTEEMFRLRLQIAEQGARLVA